MPTAGTTNSFVTVAEADAYFDTQYNRYAEWNAITDTPAESDDKSRLLIEATNMMLYQIEWKSDYQPDVDNPGDTDNTKIEYACCEQAWHLYLKDRQTEDEAKGIKEVVVESIEVEFDKTDRSGLFPSSVLNLIEDYITSAPGSVNIPVVRA